MTLHLHNLFTYMTIKLTGPNGETTITGVWKFEGDEFHLFVACVDSITENSKELVIPTDKISSIEIIK